MLSFMKEREQNYPGEPYFLFNQPLSDSGLPAATPDGTSAAAGMPSATASSKINGVLGRFDGGRVVVWMGIVCVSAFLWI